MFELKISECCCCCWCWCCYHV